MKHFFIKGRGSNSFSISRAAVGLTPKPLAHAMQHIFLMQGTAASPLFITSPQCFWQARAKSIGTASRQPFSYAGSSSKIPAQHGPALNSNRHPSHVAARCLCRKEGKSRKLICVRCISDLTGGRKAPQINLNDINVSYN